MMLESKVEEVKLRLDGVSQEALKRIRENQPFRIRLKKTPELFNGWLGMIENSFSLRWSNERVYIYWSGTAYSNLGTTHQLNAIADAKANGLKEGQVFDPLSDSCPVIIDWDSWVSAESKFNRRNAPFKVK